MIGKGGGGGVVEWRGRVGVLSLGFHADPSCSSSNIEFNCVASRVLNFNRTHKWNSRHAVT